MSTVRRSSLVAAAALLIAGVAFAVPQPKGGEVVLQSAEGNGLSAPRVAVAADGTLWSVWEDDVSGIGARAFAPDLSAVAPMSPVAGNRLPDTVPYHGPALVREGATVTPLADGRLFVVWREEHLDLRVDIFYQRSEVTSSAIAGRLIGPSGQPASRIFTIEERAGKGLGTPTAVAVADRRIAVAWTATDDDGEPGGVFARIVAPNGRALSSKISIDDVSGGVRPALAPATDGGFLAAWQRPDEAGIAVRGFDADGLPTGPAEAVVTGAASLPTLVRGGDGAYLVAWVGPVAAPADGMLEHQVYGRTLDPQGVPVGSAVALSSGGGRAHTSPALVAAGDGYLAAWTVWDRNFPRSVRSVFLDSLGRTVGDSVRLSERTVNFQWSLALAATPDGRYVVSWEGYDDEGGRSINGRVLADPGATRTACLASVLGGGCAD